MEAPFAKSNSPKAPKRVGEKAAQQKDLQSDFAKAGWCRLRKGTEQQVVVLVKPTIDDPNRAPLVMQELPQRKGLQQASIIEIGLKR